jgi:hypothetical protein
MVGIGICLSTAPHGAAILAPSHANRYGQLGPSPSSETAYWVTGTAT